MFLRLTIVFTFLFLGAGHMAQAQSPSAVKEGYYAESMVQYQGKNGLTTKKKYSELNTAIKSLLPDPPQGPVGIENAEVSLSPLQSGTIVHLSEDGVVRLETFHNQMKRTERVDPKKSIGKTEARTANLSTQNVGEPEFVEPMSLIELEKNGATIVLDGKRISAEEAETQMGVPGNGFEISISKANTSNPKVVMKSTN